MGPVGDFLDSWIQSKGFRSLVVEPTHLKNMLVKMGSSSPIFGLKPPPRFIWNLYHEFVHFLHCYVTFFFDMTGSNGTSRVRFWRIAGESKVSAHFHESVRLLAQNVVGNSSIGFRSCIFGWSQFDTLLKTTIYPLHL